jgi:hypothetical protein
LTYNVEDIIYFIGGMKAQGEYTNEVVALDIRDFTWRRIDIAGDTFLPPICGHSSCAINTSIIIIGGVMAEDQPQRSRESPNTSPALPSLSGLMSPAGTPTETLAPPRKTGGKNPKKAGLKYIYVFETTPSDIREYLPGGEDEESPARKTTAKGQPPPIPYGVPRNGVMLMVT